MKRFIWAIMSAALGLTPCIAEAGSIRAVFFDLHLVVLDSTMKKDFFAGQNVGDLFTMAWQKMAKKFYNSAAYQAEREIQELSKKYMLSGYAQAAIYEKYGLTKEAQAIKILANSYEINAQVAVLIQKLNSKGIACFVASNITSDAYAKFHDQFQAIGLQPGLIVDENVFTHQERARISDQFGNRFSSSAKPDAAYFTDLINVAHEKGYDLEEILFVDDLAKNIEAAKAQGIPSFHFIHTWFAIPYTNTLLIYMQVLRSERPPVAQAHQ